MLPNFLHIGAAKCKSSWLYQVCLAHPDIYVPGNSYDNVNFFVNAYHRGLDWYESTFFADVGNETAIGEFSNSYHVFEPALARIAHHLPEVKLTLTVMNPVHRLFYNWAHIFLKKKCAMTLFGESRQVSREDVEILLEKCGMEPDRGMLFTLDRLVRDRFESAAG